MKKHQFNLFIDRPEPDPATLERLINGLERLGYPQRAIKAFKNEKACRGLAFATFCGGLIWHPLLIASIVFVAWAFLHCINYTLLLRLMRKYCEDNY
jgi:hypothetical protein